MKKINEFFEQDQARQQAHQDFAARYQQDPEQLTDDEVSRHYRELANHLDDQDMDAAHQLAFAQMSEDDRRTLAQQYQYATRDPSRAFQGYPAGTDFKRMAQPRQLGRMTRDAARNDPELLEQLVGPDSPLPSASAKLAMAGTAAALASRYFAKR